MTPYKTKLLLSILLITTLACILSLNSYAQQEVKERGWRKKPISKKDLIKHFEADQFVDGYIINGSDIMEITNEKIYVKYNEKRYRIYRKINIENSVIEGGLDFSKLSTYPFEMEVKNDIRIWNSEIKTWGETVLGEIAARSQSIKADSVHFSGVIHFGESIFDGYASFNRASMVEQSFDKVIFSESVSFGGTIFGIGSITFENATFGKEADFRNSTFMREVSFRNATFKSAPNFENATFYDETDFGNATFERDASFSGAKFFREFLLGNASFREYVNLRETRIRNLNFKNATSTSIIGAFFDLRDAKITKAHFENVIFKNGVDFSESDFGKLIKEEGFMLLSQYDLYWPAFIYRLKKEVSSNQDKPSKQIWKYFDDSLKNELNNYPKDIEEPDIFLKEKIINQLNTILERKDFYDQKLFKGLEESNPIIKTLLKKDRNKLTDSEIVVLNRLLLEASYPDIIYELGNIDNISTVFRFVTFESDVNFTRTKFYSDIAFENVNFKKEADFTNAEFKRTWDDREPKFSLSYTKFKNLILNFGQLPKPGNWVRDPDDRIRSYVDIIEEKQEKKAKPEKELQPLSQVLAGLEATFRNNSSLSDVNQTHFYMKIAELKEKTKDKPYRGLNALERWEWILWGWNSGYGTKIWWIIGWYFGFLAFFTAIYWKWGTFYRTKSDDDSSFRLRLVVFPWQYFTPVGAKYAYNNKPKLANASRFSGELIGKLGYGNTTISGSKWLKAVVIFEWALGFYLLAIFAITLKNTVPILNSLVHGIF